MRNIIWSVVCFCSVGMLVGQMVGAAEQKDDVFAGLRSRDLSVRREAARNLVKTGLADQVATNSLLALVVAGGGGSSNTVERDSTQWLGIHLLGQLRIQESVPWLIEHIELHDPAYETAHQTQEMLTFDYYFPCAEALIMMRDGATKKVEEAVVRSEISQLKAELLLGTLWRSGKTKDDIEALFPKGKDEALVSSRMELLGRFMGGPYLPRLSTSRGGSRPPEAEHD